MTSLRARLVLSTCVVALAALAVAVFATYTAYTSSQLREVDDTLQRIHEPVEHLIAQADTDLKAEIEQVVPGLFVAVISPDGRTELTIEARIPGHDPLLTDIDHLTAPDEQTDAYVDRPAFSTRRSTDGSTQLRLRTSRLSDGTVLVLGQSMEQILESRRHLLVIESIVGALALAVAAILGWLLVHAGLRPLRQVEATALQIADRGDLDVEVPGHGRSTEIGRLAGALNTMLDRIRQAFAERDAKELALQTSEQRMRQFVADVSHELRTPLAAVSAYTELIDRGARDRPDDLARALRGISLESERMRELVEELLLLAHLDEGRALQLATVDLGEVVVEAVGAARAVSREWPIQLRMSELVLVAGDSGRLRQILDNLLANVRTHTPPGTTTTIELSTVGDRGVMTVSDDGPGMPADAAEHAFERFYRADPSRSRRSGGAGLGMAIVHALVAAHGGRIQFRTAPGAGVSITIELPLARQRVPWAGTT
ncbi:MAG: Sensor protein [Acidimicrobiales bacterium]|nr:Sensor protein [Acidimicrobiales bacterium]